MSTRLIPSFARPWDQTKLFQVLERRTDDESRVIASLLRIQMPRIETVLKSGATSPTDFTLHDDEHAFRVAELSAKVVPSLEVLSSYDLALLLLSAYLHDIGMTPAQAVVRAHWAHLIFGPRHKMPGTRALTQAESDTLQKWLDDEGHSLVPPLCTDGKASPDDIVGSEREFVEKTDWRAFGEERFSW